VADDESHVVVLGAAGALVWQAPRRLCCNPTLVRFSSDGRRLVVADDAQLRVFHVGGDWKEQNVPVGLDFRPSSLAFTPDARTVVVGGMAGDVRFLDLDTGNAITVHRPDGGPIAAVEVSPDGRRLAIIGARGLRVLGGAVPHSLAAAERITRLRVTAGFLHPLPQEVEQQLLGQYPAAPMTAPRDPAAAEFFRLLGAGGLDGAKPTMWFEWIVARLPFLASPAMTAWLRTHPDHPLAKNPLQWTRP
jgi:hypothetical protein